MKVDNLDINWLIIYQFSLALKWETLQINDKQSVSPTSCPGISHLILFSCLFHTPPTPLPHPSYTPPISLPTLLAPYFLEIPFISLFH